MKIVIKTCEPEGDYDELYVNGTKVGRRVDLDIEDVLLALDLPFTVEEGKSSVQLEWEAEDEV